MCSDEFEADYDKSKKCSSQVAKRAPSCPRSEKRLYAYVFTKLAQASLPMALDNLNIQVPHTKRVSFDKGPARFNLVTHKRGKDVIGCDDIFDLDSH